MQHPIADSQRPLGKDEAFVTAHTGKGGLRCLGSLLVLALLACVWAQPSQRLELRIDDRANDALEFRDFVNDSYPAGATWTSNTTVSFMYQKGQTDEYGPLNAVGLRFPEVALPAGATLTRAYLEFTALSDGPGTVTLEIAGEASPEPAPFADQAVGDISDRPRTEARVRWEAADWVAGTAYATPDLSSVVQELIDQEVWEAGGDLVFIVTGTPDGAAFQTAHSHRSNPDLAPRLVIEYREAAADAAEEPETEAGAEPEPEAEAEPVPEAEPEAAPEDVPAEAAEEPAPVEQPRDEDTRGRQRQARYELTALAGDLRGSLLIADYGRAPLVLTLFLSGADAAGRGAALGFGDCETGGDTLLVLEPTGTGGYSTTLSASGFATLTQANLQVRVFASPDATGEVLACGEVGP